MVLYTPAALIVLLVVSEVIAALVGSLPLPARWALLVGGLVWMGVAGARLLWHKH